LFRTGQFFPRNWVGFRPNGYGGKVAQIRDPVLPIFGLLCGFRKSPAGATLTFRAYLVWLIGLPPLLRWFPILILVRPIADNLYFLKNVSPFLSPPYIIGVLTPVLCAIALLSFKYPNRSKIDRAATWWGLAILIAIIGLIIYDPLSLISLEFVLKLGLPIYLFFFLRIFITDLQDFRGILQSTIYAAIFVAAVMLYELLVNPIGVQESRGLERIQGGFGDVVSYGMYVIFSLIIASYFYFVRQKGEIAHYGMGTMIAVIVLGVLALVNIHHTATYSIFTLILGLFFLYQFRQKAPVSGIILLLLLGLAMSYWGSLIVEERISPLLQTDLEVISGDKDSDRLLHGRVGRWRKMLEIFVTQPLWVQFFGYSFQSKPPYSLIGIGAHNDFIRILFATGFFGLICYLRFLAVSLARLAKVRALERFLLIGIFLSLLFYSISVTPTFYAPFMYIAMAAIAFLALPEEKLTQWNRNES